MFICSSSSEDDLDASVVVALFRYFGGGRLLGGFLMFLGICYVIYAVFNSFFFLKLCWF